MFIAWWSQPKQQLAFQLGLPSSKSALQQAVALGQIPDGKEVLKLADTLVPAYPYGSPSWVDQFNNDVAAQVKAVATGTSTSAAAVAHLASTINTLNKQ